MDEADIFPTIHARIIAAATDGVILVGVLLTLSGLYVFIFPSSRLFFVIVATIFLFGYEPVLVSTTGQTLGHRIKGFRAVDNKTKNKLGIGRAFLRFIIKSTLGLVSLTWMLFTKRQRSLHDILTGSLVVNVTVPSQALHDLDLASERMDADSPFQQRSIKRRVFVSITWLIVCFAIVKILEAFLFPDCVDEPHTVYCRNIEAIFDMVDIIMWGAIFILGASGRLPGAKRILKGGS